MNKSLIASTSSSETSHTLPPALPRSRVEQTLKHPWVLFWLDEEGIVKFVVTQMCKEPKADAESLTFENKWKII